MRVTDIDVPCGVDRELISEELIVPVAERAGGCIRRSFSPVAHVSRRHGADVSTRGLVDFFAEHQHRFPFGRVLHDPVVLVIGHVDGAGQGIDRDASRGSKLAHGVAADAGLADVIAGRIRLADLEYQGKFLRRFDPGGGRGGLEDRRTRLRIGEATTAEHRAGAPRVRAFDRALEDGRRFDVGFGRHVLVGR